MTTDQPDQAAPPPANVAALVDAIDARARQAGTEGATDVLQQMLGAVTDALERIQERLDALEDLVDGGGAADAVQAGLAAFNARLGRLEEAFVQAVDESGSGTQAVVEEVRAVVSNVLAASVPLGPAPAVDGDGTRDALARVEAAMAALASAIEPRLGALERALQERGAAPMPADPSVAVRAAVAPLTERVDELDAAQRATSTRQLESMGRMEAALAAMPGRLTTLEERVWAVVSSLTDASSVGAARASVDPALLARLEEVVDRLERDESAARLVKLVEERLSAGLRAVTERTDEVRRAVDQLAASAAPLGPPPDDGALDDLVASVRALQSATHDVPDEVASSIGSRLSPLSDRLAGLDGRLDVLHGLVQQLGSAVAAPAEAAPPDPAPALHELADKVDALSDLLRREAELLTQRVASLAVGVEATRVLVDQHHQDTEHSIGRKAGEVTRRLAADFGIRTRRNGPEGRRDPRELGSG